MRRSRLLVAADRLRRLYWRLVSPRTIGVRILVVDDAGRVLLVRHTYGPGHWQLPGGGVKRRETMARAAVRELAEETGIEVIGGPAALTLLGAYTSLREGKSDHVAVYVCDGWRPGAADSREIAGHAFFPLDALPDGASDATRRRIEEYRGRRPPEHDW